MASTTHIQKQARLIYDSLDNNAPKQAFSLCQKARKKNPEVNLFKALQALAASCLGKQGEAHQLANELLLLKELDVLSLTALGNTLRRINRDNESADCFERAFKLNESEDYLLEAFYSSLKAFNFKRAHAIALSLFKKFGIFRYYIWATMTLYSAAQLSEKEEGDVTSIKIVEKMVEKALSQKKFTNFQEYSLCLLMSDKNKDTMSLLLDIPKDIFPTQIDHIKWCFQLLKQIGNYSEIIKLSRNLPSLITLLEDWECLCIYIDACHKGNISRLEILPAELIDMNKDFLKRTYLLGQLEIAKTYGEPIEHNVHSYFEEFSQKDSCFSDLLPYLDIYTESSYFKSFLESILPESSEIVIRKSINALKIHCYIEKQLEAKSNLCDANFLFNLYEKWRNPELPCSDLLLLAVINLIEQYNEKKNTSLLFRAGVWLYEASQRNDNHFYIKLFLICILRELGGVSLALSLYESLNIKNIQIDMLSFIVFDWMPIIGFQKSVLEFCSDIESLYENNTKETPLMLLEAYRHGSFSQIPEFVDFYLRLKHSIQGKINQVTRLQSEILSLDTKNDLIHYFQHAEFRPLQKTVIDNRPLDDIFSYWAAYSPWKVFIKKNGCKDTSWLETCYAILISMKSAFGFFDRILPLPGNSLQPIQIESLLKELSIDTPEKEQVDPLLGDLLRMVNEAYHQRYKDLTKSIIALEPTLKNAIHELNHFDIESMTPDTLIIKLESIVEIIHYATIFLVATHYVTGVAPVEAVQVLLNVVHILLDLPLSVMTPSLPSKQDLPGEEAFITHLIDDWSLIARTSCKHLESFRRILKSLLTK